MKFLLLVLLFVSVLCSVAMSQKETLGDKITSSIIKLRAQNTTKQAFAHVSPSNSWDGLTLTVKEHIQSLQIIYHDCPQSARFLSAAASTYDRSLVDKSINKELSKITKTYCSSK